MKKTYFSKINISAFCISLIGILIPVSICCGYFFAKVISSNSIQYEKDKQLQMNSIHKTIQKEFEQLKDISTDFLYQKWITRYTNNINLYADDFNLFSKRDIVQSISTKCSSSAYVEDIYIVVPSKKTVVSPDGWFAIDEFLFLNEDISFDNLYKSSIDFPQTPHTIVISSDKSKMIMTDVNKFLSDPLCSVSIVIDKDKLYKHMQNISLGQFEDATVVVNSNGEVFPKLEKDGMVMVQKSMRDYKLDIIFKYKTYNTAVESKELMSFFLIGIMLIILSLIASMIITIKISYPVQKLLNSIYKANQKFSNAKESCEYISRYVLDMVENNKSLSIALEKYKQTANKEMIFSMLTDESFEYNQDNILSLFPWTKQEKLPYVVVLFQQKDIQMRNSDCRISSEVITTLLNEQQMDFYLFEIVTCDIGAIVWVDDITHLRLLEQNIKEKLSESWNFAISEQKEDICSLNECYIDVKYQLISLLNNDISSIKRISVVQEFELINAIINYKQEQFCDVFNSIYEMYANEGEIFAYIQGLMVRMASEYNIIDKITLGATKISSVLSEEQLEYEWRRLKDECISVCSAIHFEKNKSSADMSFIIKEYIDKNYSNQDMSLKLLSEVFSITSSMISKIYKNSFDINFSDYLLNLRVEKSKELLINSDESVTNISAKVGYLNYLSFKRAFIRSTGVSPKDFRGGLSST